MISAAFIVTLKFAFSQADQVSSQSTPRYKAPSSLMATLFQIGTACRALALMSLLAIAITVSSCGDSSDPSDPPGLFVPPQPGLPPPLSPSQPPKFNISPFFYQDPSCWQTHHTQPQRLSSVGYRSWNGHTTAFTQLSSSSIKGLPVLSSGLIKNTYAPRTFEMECLQHSAISTCGFVNHQHSVPLKICHAQALYPKDSVEHVALTSLAHLEKAYLFYLAHKPAMVAALPRAQLYILPQFITKHKHALTNQPISESTTYDNLSYIEKFYDTPTFIIHPPTPTIDPPNSLISSSSSSPPKPYLWEYPWALAHELGHHILISHSKFSEYQANQQLLPLTLFPNSGFFDKVVKVSASPLHSSAAPMFSSIPSSAFGSWPDSLSVDLLRSASLTHAVFPADLISNLTHHLTNINQHSSQARRSWIAFNEAYADLFATLATAPSEALSAAVISPSNYVHSSPPATFSDIPCLIGNRDVTYPRFNDGTPKIITSQAVHHFHHHPSRGIAGRVLSSCHAGNFEIPHVIGATLAHGLWRLGTSNPMSRGEIAQRMISLADHLSQLFSKPGGWEMNLSSLTALAVAHLQAPLISSDQPQRESSHYPDLRPGARLPLSAPTCQLLFQQFSGLINHWSVNDYFSCEWPQSG